MPRSLGGTQTPSNRRTYMAHPTLLLFGPDHRTAARVGNAREEGSLGAEGVAEGAPDRRAAVTDSERVTCFVLKFGTQDHS